MNKEKTKSSIKKCVKLLSDHFRKFLEFVFSQAFRDTLKKMYLNGIDLLNRIIKYLERQNTELVVAGFVFMFIFLLIAFGLSLQ